MPTPGEQGAVGENPGENLTEEAAASFEELFGTAAGTDAEPETEDGGDWWTDHDAEHLFGGRPGGNGSAAGLHGGGRADADARHLIDGDGFDHSQVASWHDRCRLPAATSLQAPPVAQKKGWTISHCLLARLWRAARAGAMEVACCSNAVLWQPCGRLCGAACASIRHGCASG